MHVCAMVANIVVSERFPSISEASIITLLTLLVLFGLHRIQIESLKFSMNQWPALMYTLRTEIHGDIPEHDILPYVYSTIPSSSYIVSSNSFKQRRNDKDSEMTVIIGHNNFDKLGNSDRIELAVGAYTVPLKWPALIFLTVGMFLSRVFSAARC